MVALLIKKVISCYYTDFILCITIFITSIETQSCLHNFFVSKFTITFFNHKLPSQFSLNYLTGYILITLIKEYLICKPKIKIFYFFLI